MLNLLDYGIYGWALALTSVALVGGLLAIARLKQHRKRLRLQHDERMAQIREQTRRALHESPLFRTKEGTDNAPAKSPHGAGEKHDARTDKLRCFKTRKR